MNIPVTGETVAFLILAMMAIGGAIFMIFSTRVMHMALSLAFTFFSLAGIYLMLDAEFVAVVQVLVYTGAVTILMLFGIMLTKQQSEEEQGTEEGPRRTNVPRRMSHVWLSLIFAGAFFGLLYLVLYNSWIPAGHADSRELSLVKLGETVFKQYVIPFEVASLLLLAALVGAVILARREDP
ncbi:NADH-quinone oxidoreductase subunit J [Staphylospora marina]|uniref:NADH-quinone oxidoreductase subunit J n=1 Tax=Staphylospora marina TaxID=2490858 RepID=UPI000F5BA3AA|nr:NADH-quinone oxidoreductase subunit J [Staphylospora marina]